MILDQYGAADIVIAEVELKRAYPGGPALGEFTARFGPDGVLLGRFSLRVPRSDQIPRMMDEGVRRMDMIYSRALAQGLLQPDPSLVIIEPAPPPPEELEAPEAEETVRPSTAPPPVVSSSAAGFTIQVETPDPAAVQQAEVSVSRVSGVTSAITTSLALGGTSVMRVTYTGDPASLEAALRSQGWSVQSLGGNGFRISR